MRFYLLLFFLGIGTPVFAQRITGVVQDKTGAAAPFSTVILLTAPDSTLAAGTLAAEDGTFELKAPKTGSYILKASMIGSGTTRQPITVGEADILGLKLVLQSDVHMLKEAEVVARKPFITQEAGRMVVNVEGSIVATGANTLDVLRRTPGVVTDQSGASISLKGKSDVLILIDGKPTQLSAGQLGTYLKALPANQVKEIEVMTNPDASYDAQGNAGIINIRLKKGGAEGITGQVDVSAGTGSMYKSMSSASFSLRKGLSHVALNYSYADNGGFFTIDTRRIQAPGAATAGQELHQDLNYYWTRSYGHTLSGQGGFQLSKRTSVDFAGMYSNELNLFLGKIDVTTQAAGVQTGRVVSYDHNPDRYSNGSGRATIKHTFDEDSTRPGKHELSGWIDIGNYNQRSSQNTPYDYYDANNNIIKQDYLSNFLPAYTNVQVAAVDYFHPISKNLKLQVGSKVTAVQVTSKTVASLAPLGAENPAMDTSLSSDFRYKEQVQALYGSADYKRGKWDVKLGLRVERWQADGQQRLNGQDFSRLKVWPFPNLQTNFQVDSSNALNFSYSRRIDRPAYNSLNPIRFYSDPYNFFSGNPALKPQLTDNVELSHVWKDGTLITTLNGSLTSDVINEYAPTLAPNPAIQGVMPQNMGQQLNAGLSVFATANWLNNQSPTQFYINGYYLSTTGQYVGQGINNKGWSFMANLLQQYNWGKGWGAEVSAFYQHGIRQGIGQVLPFGQLSFGMQKEVMHERGMLKLAVQDALWTMYYRMKTDFGPFKNASTYREDSRTIMLTFTYRFGDLKAPKPGVDVEKDNRVKMK